VQALLMEVLPSRELFFTAAVESQLVIEVHVCAHEVHSISVNFKGLARVLIHVADIFSP
jgi:hypothetical protein